MSVTEAGQVASVSPDPRGHRWYRFRWRWLILPTALAVAVLIAFLAYGASYQPLTSSGPSPVGQWGWHGLPAGVVRTVNAVGGAHNDLYAPPQRGYFSIEVEIANDGPFAVTIESVTIPGSGLLVGQVRSYTAFSYPRTQPTLRGIRDLVLPPRSAIHVGISLRTWACARHGAWVRIQGFTVTEESLGSTRSVVLPLDQQGDSLLIHPGGRPGQQGVICAR